MRVEKRTRDADVGFGKDAGEPYSLELEEVKGTAEGLGGVEKVELLFLEYCTSP